MKNLTLLILSTILLFSCNNESIDSQEPPCDNGTFVGAVILKTQQDVNDFGALCYSKIDGYLLLFDEDESIDKILDLSPLNSLTEIFH